MRLQLEEAEEYLTFPADSILHLKVDNIVSEERDGNSGRYTRLNFTFIIQGIQHIGEPSPHPAEAYQVMVGSKIFGSTSATFNTSPNNKLRNWAEAILGMSLSPGFDLDTDLLIGRRARGVTSVWVGKKPDPITQKPKSGHQIAALLPAASQQGPAQQAQQPAQQPQQPAQQQQQPAQQWPPSSPGFANPAEAWEQPPF